MTFRALALRRHFSILDYEDYVLSANPASFALTKGGSWIEWLTTSQFGSSFFLLFFFWKSTEFFFRWYLNDSKMAKWQPKLSRLLSEYIRWFFQFTPPSPYNISRSATVIFVIPSRWKFDPHELVWYQNSVVSWLFEGHRIIFRKRGFWQTDRQTVYSLKYKQVYKEVYSKLKEKSLRAKIVKLITCPKS